MNGAGRHPLRKACDFCRSRKIKCSGETICEACRKQDINCIYDFEYGQSNLRSTYQQDGYLYPGAGHSANAQDSNLTSASVEQDASSSAGVLSIASELELMYYDNFSTENHVRGNAWHQKIASFLSSLEGCETANLEQLPSQNPDILSAIAKEIIALLVSKFGALGCHLVESGGGRLLVDGFRRDRSVAMFDPVPSAPDHLAEFGTRKTTQLVDIWFSNHPLSFLISKTLMMHELRCNTLDKTLLAVILADAHFFMDDPEAAPRGQVLLQLAEVRLQAYTSPKPVDVASAELPGSTKGSPSSSTMSPDISIVQTLVILGWNKICHSQIRRAMCYIGLACRLTRMLKESKWSNLAATVGSRINGIDVAEVENEMVTYLWWINFTIFQWLFMQMDEQLPYVPRNILTSRFLPVDAASSSLIHLDETSDHISTLHKQKVALTDMWPLAHICSVIAYIYELYPEDTQPDEPLMSVPWQEAALSGLERIRNNSRMQNIDQVCREVYRVLMENVSVLNSEVESMSSRTPVLVMYHTVAIHVLFPRMTQENSSSQTPSLTSESIERVYTSANELINIIRCTLESIDGKPFSQVQSHLHPCSPEIFILALDTCSRAISTILSASSSSTCLFNWASHEPRLRAIIAKLHELSQAQFFSPGPSFRAVKKQVEILAQQFGIQSSCSSHGHRWNVDLDHPLFASSVSMFETGVNSLGPKRNSTNPVLTTSHVPIYCHLHMDRQQNFAVNGNSSTQMDGMLHSWDCRTSSHVFRSELDEIYNGSMDDTSRLFQSQDEQIMLDLDRSINN